MSFARARARKRVRWIELSNIPGLVLWLRFLKLIGTMCFAAGVLSAMFPMAHPTRARLIYVLGGAGFLISWAAGFIYAPLIGYPLTQSWVLGSMVSSVFTLNVLLYLAGKAERYGVKPCVLATAGFLVTVALMVWRPV